VVTERHQVRHRQPEKVRGLTKHPPYSFDDDMFTPMMMDDFIVPSFEPAGGAGSGQQRRPRRVRVNLGERRRFTR